MEDRIYDVLRTINSEDVYNSQWGITEQQDISSFFGVMDKEEFLDFRFIYVYLNDDNADAFVGLNPDKIVVDKFGQVIHIYKV